MNVVDKNTVLRIPEGMVAEHEELHEELYAATEAPGAVGEAARAVADALHAHFENEEAFALPPLGLLGALAAGTADRQAMEQVLPLTQHLKADLPQMLAEHAVIVGALDRLAAAAQAAGEQRYVRFAEKLKLHAQTEEEVAYPTAILIGEYIKLILGATERP